MLDSLPFIIYFIDVLAGHPFGGLTFLCVVGLLASGACMVLVNVFARHEFAGPTAEEQEENKRWWQQTTRRLSITFTSLAVLFCTLNWLIPEKETMYTILAVSAGAELVQTEAAQQIGGDVGRISSKSLQVLEQFLDEHIEQPDKK